MKNINNKTGFTLIELIVSISIIALISTVMLSNYKAGGSAEELNAAAQNLVSEIRKVQSYALGYKEFNGALPTTGGWGIRLTSNSANSPENFVLFFDLNVSGKREVTPPDETYLVGTIGKNVSVSDIIYNVSGTDYHRDFFWGVFIPPDPVISLNVSDTAVGGLIDAYSEVQITLKHTSGKTKTIILNKFGLVDVD